MVESSVSAVFVISLLPHRYFGMCQCRLYKFFFVLLTTTLYASEVNQ